MKHRILLAAACLLTVVIVAGKPAAAAFDTIRTKTDNRMLQCRIQSEDVDKISYKDIRGEEVQTIPQREIDYVRYGDVPRDLRTARSEFEAGKYPEALRHFLSALKAPNVREFWRDPECYYYIAECHLRSGQPDQKEAAKYPNKLNKEYPNNKYMAKAKVTLADLLMKQEKYSEARSVFEEIEEAKGPDGAPRFSDDVHFDAAMGVVRCFVKQEQSSKALSKLRRLEPKAAMLGPGKVYQVRVQHVLVNMENGDYEKAKESAQGIIRKAKQDYKSVVSKSSRSDEIRPLRVALAKCFNVVGDVFRKSDAEDHFREALINYLWVVVLFDDSPKEHAKALLNAGLCYEKIDNEVKSKLMWKELKSRYPNSVAARKIPE